jgi:hypothetical protein
LEREPTLIYSPLNGHFTKDGVTVEVSIISSDIDPAWSLEVVNDVGTSVVWDEQFETDGQAYAAFRRVVEEEGMQAFADQAEASNVIPFRRPQ